MTTPLPPSPLGTPAPWELVADAYAVDLIAEFEGYAADALRLANLPPGARVVDVATGPGTLALLAARAGARVSALDFSPAMIANLRRRAGRLDLDVRVGDGQALPFDSDAHDAAFSMFGLMFFPDRARGLRELWRVLRPGGRAFVASWGPFQGPFAVVMQSLQAEVPELPPGPAKLPLATPEDVTAELTAAGFREVTVHRLSHAWVLPSTAELWATMQRSTAPVVLLRQRLGEARWAEVAAAVLARARGILGEGPVDAPGVAYLGVGTR
jgi:SAM-dependent methyltransferase